MISPHSNLQRMIDEAMLVWKPVSVVFLLLSALLWIGTTSFQKPPVASPESTGKPIASPSPRAVVQKPQAPVVVEHAQPKPTLVQQPLAASGEIGSKPVESAKPETVPVPQAQLPAAAPAKASVENFTPPAPVQKPQVQAVVDAAPPKPMTPVSSPSPVPPPAAIAVTIAKSETPSVPQKPKDEWAEYSAQMRSVLAEEVLRKDEADVLAALSLECTSVTHSRRVSADSSVVPELIVVIARFRLASIPKQPGKPAWSQAYSCSASIEPTMFQGTSSPETIKRVIKELKRKLLADKETLTKLQESLMP